MKSFFISSIGTVIAFWVCCLINVNLAWVALGISLLIPVVTEFVTYKKGKDIHPERAFIGSIIGILVAMLSWGLIMNP